MAKQDDGGAAFPINTLNVPFSSADAPEYRGMTLRDYFAAKAMAAMIAQYPCQAIDNADGGMSIDFQALAGDAYEMADEMLATRSLPDNAMYTATPAT